MIEAAFLADIIEHPDDDTPRLVYADWLQEHGRDARAELIRTQIERARLDPHDVRQVALARREDALLGEHGRGWAGEVAEVCSNWEFRRGMVEMAHPRPQGFAAAAHRLFASHPIRELHLQSGGLAPPVLREVPALARVERLTFHGLNEGVVEALRSPHWSRLCALKVKRVDGLDDVAEAIGAATWAGRLKWLELSSSDLSFRGVQALVRAGLGSLEWIDLAFNDAVGGRGALRLVRAELPKLTGARFVSVGLTSRDARRLAEAPELARLRHLEVGYNDLRTGAAALVGSPHLHNLVVLDLSSTGMGPHGLTALAESPHFSKLTQLEVSSCQIGPAELRQLMGNVALRGLRSLDIGTNPITPDGAELLASDESPWELRHLDLRFGRLLDEGVRNLLRPKLSSLQTLTLHANSIGPEAATEIARAPHFPNLRILGMKNNRIGAEGAAALASTEELQLLTIELETNVLSDDSKARLRARYGSGVSFSQ